MELPGHVTVDVSSVPDATGAGNGQLLLHNNLSTAIEVQLREQVQVLYPDKCCALESSSSVNPDVIKVCLRDDPSICGTCSIPDKLTTLRASDSFGRFGPDAEGYLQKEKEEVQREQDLRQKRKDVMSKEHSEAQERALCVFFLGVFLMILVGVSGAVILYVEPEDPTHAAVLSGLSIIFLCGCAWGALISIHTGGLPCKSWIWKCLTYNGGFACYFLAALGVAAALSRYVLAGFWWAPLIAGPPFCIILAVLCRRRWEKSLKDHVETVEKDVSHEIAERTLVFNGQVLPTGKCVCSWPGKYESAWAALVQNSRDGNLSAAVVFLPHGSEHYGVHDQIPEYECAGWSRGSCWCVPLYGEQKPWGCRWWTKWMANVKRAVASGVELEVYFFKGMKGKGKVRNFSTAGTEHMLRETIQSERHDFLKSEAFQAAVDAGIEDLSKELCGDSSSQYSREVHRLFLASLSEGARGLMEASEGLGNSQKAEVAWLEQMGYAYTEVEVDLSAWLQD